MKIRYEKKYFDDKSGASKVSNENIEKMINDVYKNVLESDGYASIATGDTEVFGFPFDEDQDGETDTIEIYVCRNSEKAILLKEDGNWNLIDWEQEDKDNERFEELNELNKDDFIEMIIEMEKEEEKSSIWSGTISCCNGVDFENSSSVTLKPADLYAYTSTRADYNPRKEV